MVERLEHGGALDDPDQGDGRRVAFTTAAGNVLAEMTCDRGRTHP